MRGTLYLCPHTGAQVDGWFADGRFAHGETDGGDVYETVRCQACQRLHWVSRNGRVAGAGLTKRPVSEHFEMAATRAQAAGAARCGEPALQGA